MASLITANIYKIVSPNTDKIYIGSTKRTLRQRMNNHISEYNKKRYCTSKIILAAGNATIELIEVFNCDNRKELHQREGYYIRLYINICVNKIIPDRTKAEYYQENRDEILEQHKQFYESHKEQILEQVKQYNEAHKEQIAAKKKVHYATHKKQILEQRKQHYEINKDQILAQRKHRNQAKRQAAPCQGCPDWLAQQTQPLISQVESLDQ